MAWAAPAAPLDGDLLIADFEGGGYGDWVVEGNAFGSAPASGTLPGQMKVDGFRGEGLVNSYLGGDDATGTLTSPPFEILKPHITFLIGGGGFAGETCINLVLDGEVVRSRTGSNTAPGGTEALDLASWDVAEFAGQQAVIQIVDQRRGGWGHVNVDHIVQSDSGLYEAITTLRVDGTHLHVPVANTPRPEGERQVLLGLYDGDRLVQNLTVTLPREHDVYWMAAYPLNSFGVEGREITIRPSDRRYLPRTYQQAFDLIACGDDFPGQWAEDYGQPYRNQFHVSTRRGWNNDPNGLVHHNGRYHLYYQHNPVGIFWGNMHWGHLESDDLIHWRQEPIALYQNTVHDMMFSGGGFIDFNNSAGLGTNTLFVAFTSTGRGECLAYSQDGGVTFAELPENPVVRHRGRDPKILWYEPDQKWVMAVYNASPCAETAAVPADPGQKHENANVAFHESRDLRVWTRTGAFTHADRHAVFECPELFELPVDGDADEQRWILYGAQNRYFVGHFNGRTFVAESGPHGSRHGAFYAAQTFSDVPDGRRIQIGWVRTASYPARFPGQIVNQSFTLPHELSLKQTPTGPRLCFTPVAETRKLRTETLARGTHLTPAEADHMLQACVGALTEVVLEFERNGNHGLILNGIDASFEGRSARIFTDRTFNEVYADEGHYYEVRTREPARFDSVETRLEAGFEGQVRAMTIYRLNSIWF
jgi:fructan beta-fructosidase